MLRQVTDLDQSDLYESEGEQASPAEICASTHEDYGDRRLDTLVHAIGEDLAQQFFWKAETDTIQTYEHRLTYRYVHIDSATGLFCNQQRAPISAEQALAHALNASQAYHTQLLCAPIVLEPNLVPYVRRAGVGAQEQSVPSAIAASMSDTNKLEGVGLRLYRTLRARLSAMVRSAHATSSSQTNSLRVQAALKTNEVNLIGFTRRVA